MSITAALALLLAALTGYALRGSSEEQDARRGEPGQHPLPQETPRQIRSPETPSHGQKQFPVRYKTQGRIEASVIYDEPSVYGNVTIFDYGEHIRAMMLDGAIACTYNFAQNTATTHVHEAATLVENYAPKNARVLLVGLGCGGTLKELADTAMGIDAVEINPEVAEAADTYFTLPETLTYHVAVDDGLHFLRNTEQTYDAIIVDLCEILEGNAHLYTEEFYALAKTKLKNNRGFLIQSLYTFREGDEYRLDERLARTMAQHFPHVATTEKGRDEQAVDVINIIASKSVLTNNQINTPALVPWQPLAAVPPITMQSALEAARQYITVGNEVRKQPIENFGFTVRLK